MKYLIFLTIIGIVAAASIKTRIRRDDGDSNGGHSAKSILHGQELLETVKQAIKQFEAEPARASQIAILKEEEAKLKLLLDNYIKAVDPAVLKHIHAELKKLSSKLHDDLRALGIRAHHHDDDDDDDIVQDDDDDDDDDGHHHDHTRRKNLLIIKATQLEVRAQLMVDELKAEKNDAEAGVIEAEVTGLKKLIELLKSGSATMDLHQIESQLKKAEERLHKELKHPIGWYEMVGVNY